jgi:hypothetical protein
MRMFGISFGTLIMIAIVVFIVRKYGNSIPLVNKI